MMISRVSCALLLTAVIQSSVVAEHASLTPQWAKENPGRLTMSSGTAIGGWNGYTFQLHFDSPKTFSLRSTTLLRRENGKGFIRLHSFSWSLEKPSKVLPIKLETPSYTPQLKSDLTTVERADAKINIVVYHLDARGEPNGRTDEYDLTLGDFEGIYAIPEKDTEHSPITAAE